MDIPGPKPLDFRSHIITSTAELQKLFSSTTYVVVSFYTSFDKTYNMMALTFAHMSFRHGIPGVRAFARVNQFDAPELAKQCKCDVNREAEISERLISELEVGNLPFAYGL
ncbi:hypothetical protein F4805DRAFT_49985 [Annulohypoxylon moriforme]|nr:hypothetical protein F4805DRAFT_49985 [Annulohypoxylon moriforme]